MVTTMKYEEGFRGGSRGGSYRKHHFVGNVIGEVVSPTQQEEQEEEDDATVREYPDKENKTKLLEVALQEAFKSREWLQVQRLAGELLKLEGRHHGCLSSVHQQYQTNQNNPSVRVRYDRLTVFQAEPLVWMDGHGVLHPMEALNFGWEKDALTEALQDAREVGTVELSFDIATTGRLNAFLASSQSSPILHLSCHGFPGGQLAIEDGYGATHFVDDEHLKGFYSSQQLQVVFVSACHSRSTGEAFCKAGIPHVICCKMEEQLRDSAAIEFTSSFYRALANGKTLQQAFLLAKQQVKLSPNVKESHVEMDKFVLLPERDDDYHEVQVFFTKPFVPRQAVEETPPSSGLPRPPSTFVGRQVEAYRVIAQLRKVDIVHLVGAEGLGKGLFAAVVANYANERRKILFLDEVVWCPPIDRNSSDSLDKAILELFELLATAPDILESSEYQDCRRQIVLRLGPQRTLLVIDARSLASADVSMLSLVLQDILNQLKSIKMLIICQEGGAVELSTHRRQSVIALEPITFESAATLFATFCPYVSHQCEHADPIAHSVEDFVNLIFRRDTFRKSRKVEGSMSKRSADLFSMLGEGYPEKIRDYAMTLSAEEYKEIIRTAKKSDVTLDFHTRHKLDKAILRTNLEIHHAQEIGLYQKAQEQWDLVQELQRLRLSMPSKEKLKLQLDQLEKQSKKAIAENKGRQQFIKLNREVKSLEFQLEMEGEVEKETEELVEDDSIQKEDLPGELKDEIERTAPTDGEPPQLPLVAKIIWVDDDAVPDSPNTQGVTIPLAKFRINVRQNAAKKSHHFVLQINHGPVHSFSYSSSRRAAIVVASNEACTGGQGVLRAVTKAGGPALLQHVTALSTVMDITFGPVRCLAGDATLVGPGAYDDLQVPYVLFAVAPWFATENEMHSRLFLTAAYRSALELAKEAKLEAVAFSLLGASCRGGNEWKSTVRIGFDTIARFDGYPELKEIHVFGFSSREAAELVTASKRYDLFTVLDEGKSEDI